MLTGNRYQDLPALINLYNQSGKIILTGDLDIDYQILKQLDLPELATVCRTNKYTHNLCHNKNFWLDKFKTDELPLFNHHYDNHTVKKWLNLYKRTKLGKENAINSLKVYDIQYKNIVKKPPIYIYTQDNNYKEEFENILHVNFNIIANVGFVSFKPNKDYIKIYNDKGSQKFPFAKNQMLNLLIFCYALNIKMEEEWFLIGCDKDKQLIVTEFMVNTTVSKIIHIRYGILQSIKYYDS
jgi:hypothetical protein